MSWQTLTPSQPDVISSAADFAALQSALTSCHTLLIHPFQQTVGDGEGHYKTLTFPNALDKLATKLQDDTDPFLSGDALLAIAVHDKTLEGFANKLDAVIEAMGINTFMVPAQRARNLASLESDKWTIATASPVQVPFSYKIPANSWVLTDEFTHARARQISHDTGQNLISDPLTELANLEQVKSEHDAAVVSATDDVSLENAEAKVIFLTGNLAQAVKNSGGPGPDQSLCAMFVLLGTADDLKIWREVCGL